MQNIVQSFLANVQRTFVRCSHISTFTLLDAIEGELENEPYTADMLASIQNAIESREGLFSLLDDEHGTIAYGLARKVRPWTDAQIQAYCRREVSGSDSFDRD